MNEDKMIEVLAQVEDEKERFAYRVPGALGFNMDVWASKVSESEGAAFCGTTACLAGHAVVADGYVLLNSTECGKPVPGEPRQWWSTEYIEDAGRLALGLTQSEADELFYVGTLDDVYETVAEWMGVAEVVLRDKVQASRKVTDPRE
jgi:hypothetical protein